MTLKFFRFFRSHWLLILVALVTAIAIFFNLFGYPTIEGDEGVYVAQGWWLVNFRRLAPYIYWYDHFPLAWFLIGLWQKLTGGPFTFGLSAYSGRVFISLLVITTNIFIFQIGEIVTGNKKIAFLASLWFALSPLALFFHRRVLLDNVATFWLVISIYLLLSASGRLWRFFLSGLMFGLAFLSKEVLIFFLPAYLLAISVLSHRSNRAFSLFVFLLTTFFLIAQFPLLAILKSEFLPSGWLGSGEHVSFLNTLFYQASRGTRLPFWDIKSDFIINFSAWWRVDFVLIGLGLWSFLVSLVWSNQNGRLMAIFGLSFLLFLIRGGLVFDFYIIPMIPFLAISLAEGASIITKHSSMDRLTNTILFWLVIPVLFLGLIRIDTSPFFTADLTRHQREAVNYIKSHFDPNSVVVTDATPFLDLRLSRWEGDPPFAHEEWFYKVEDEKEVRYDKLHNRYSAIDYLVLTNEFTGLLKGGSLPFLTSALINSKLMIDFPPLVANSGRDLPNLVSKENSWVAIYAVNKRRSGFAN